MDFSNRLAPYRPAISEQFYVERPIGSGRKLAHFLKAGRPVAVWGPVGCGKSTELHAAARALAPDNLAVVIPLDQLLPIREPVGRNQTAGAVGLSVYHAAERAGLRPRDMSTLAATASQLSLLPSGQYAHALSPDVLRVFLRELSRLRTTALLFDGLEKAGERTARDVVAQLQELIGDDIAWAVVLPPTLTNGPDAYSVVSELRPFFMSPVPVTDDLAEGRTGRAFLEAILRRRLNPETIDAYVWLDDAARYSGGIPRTYLQLIVDAQSIAAFRGHVVATPSDFHQAVRDHADSLERLLDAGDSRALREMGVKQMDTARRVRLLAHGLLLEYQLTNSTLLSAPHPLLTV